MNEKESAHEIMMRSSATPQSKCAKCGSLEPADTLDLDNLCELCHALENLRGAILKNQIERRHRIEQRRAARESYVEDRQLPPGDRE